MADGKGLTKDKPIAVLFPKGDAVYPMLQHIGVPARPIVEVGDRVLVGQMIARANGVVSAPVLSAVSGTVKAIEPRMTVAGTLCESVVIENTGWKLFDFIPIGGGNPERPNRCSCCFFEDTTTLQNNLDMLEREMKSVGATRIVNLSSRTIDETVFILLLTRTACRTSAVLLK